MERMEKNHFMTILLLDPYFKIKNGIYRGILGVLTEGMEGSFPYLRV